MQKLSKSFIAAEALIEGLAEAVFLIEGGVVGLANTSLLTLTGYNSAQLQGMSLLTLLGGSPVVELELWLAGEGSVPCSLEFDCASNTSVAPFPALLTVKRVVQQPQSINVATLSDRSAHLLLQNQVKQLQGEFDQLVQRIPDVFYRADAQGLLTLVSPSAEKTFGFTPQDLHGTPVADLYATEQDRQLVLSKLFEGGGKPVKVEATMLKKDGTPVWVSTNAYMRFNDKGQYIGVEGMARDSTERHNAELLLHKSANSDPLTGLANRLSFNLQLSKAVARTDAGGTGLALLYLDLDGFKAVNDSHGHGIGDELLCRVAARLKKICRKTDVLARLGGDEFVMLLESGPKVKDTEAIAEKMVLHMAEPFFIEDRDITIGASIGIAYYPQHSSDAEHFLRNADNAMYAAKNTGKGRVYSSSSMG